MSTIRYHEALERVYTNTLTSQDGYVQVPTVLFVSERDLGLPSLPAVGFHIIREGKMALIKPADQTYSTLALSLHPDIWVKDEEFPLIRKFAENIILTGNISTQVIPAESRMNILRRSALKVVDDLFENPTSENMQRSNKMVGSFVYLLMKDPKAYMMLTRLSSHDPYTLQHSVGTAVNSIILAKKMGIKDERELQEAGLAGLLHDIGKVKVKKEIINKPGPLDELEWEEMRQHTSEGFEIVKDNPDVSTRAKRAIIEHHEDKNGTGYPHGLKYTDLDIFSKVVGLADIFNALTTTRSYSDARTPFDAFQLIRAKMLHKVDENILRELILIHGGKYE